MPPVDQLEMEHWRILLLGRDGAEVLLFHGSSGLEVPEFSVPAGQRVPPYLNAEAKRRWNVETVSILPFEVPPGEAAGKTRYFVMQLHRPEEWTSLVPAFVRSSSVKETSFAFRTDYAAIQKTMTLDRNDSDPDSCGPFADFGAFRRISSWVEKELSALGLTWDGNFSQLHASPSFSLIRFSAGRCAVWFKAVGEPNLREFPVTMALAARFPRYVAKPIAARPEWNAWLAMELEGQELASSSESADWSSAAASLAEIQIASIEEARHMLGAGTRDLRCRRLLGMTHRFFSRMEMIMDAQTKTTPRKLSRQEIVAVRRQVIEAIERLQDAGIPDTLNHLDLNAANILVAGRRCKFLDWAEAAVGNPFLSYQYLHQHFLRADLGKDGEGLLLNAYLDRWATLLESAAVRTALRLTPLIAVFAYALVLPWSDVNLGDGSVHPGLLRSLVRRMSCECERINRGRAA